MHHSRQAGQRLVSIPYRHSKNKQKKGIQLKLDLVSIPYRHSKNQFLHCNIFISKHWFQFLIGTLKTLKVVSYSVVIQPLKHLTETKYTKISNPCQIELISRQPPIPQKSLEIAKLLVFIVKIKKSAIFPVRSCLN